MSIIRRLVVIPLAATALGAFVLTSSLRADEPIAPDAQKQQPPDEAKGLKKEAPTPVEVTDAARPVLEKMRQAYAKLGGLQMSGTWSVQWDINGEQMNPSAEFTSSYAAPNKYRHQTKDDLLFGSTGEKAYSLEKNAYLIEDAPKSHVAVADLPKNAGLMLQTKNPSLLLAVTAAADGETPFLAAGATKIDKGEDVKIGNASFTSLKVATKEGGDVSVLVDPATNLIRKWSIDMKHALEDRGLQNVKSAAMTIDYTTIKPEAPAGGDAFAWAPPAGAKDAAKMAAAAEEGDAANLKGKPAPAFTLKDLDGKEVKLADQKGSVVVLDFWATWCGPCRAGLPILDKVAAARKDKGLKVFAVNLEEDKDAVAAFKKETKLGVNVLLDSTGETGKAYAANAIPETVIIGKDGLVKKVMVGLHDQEALEKAIDEELK